ncbi:MAG: GDSL-type esterase/lipase family protein, partial [Actinobacteria bacterium]|nr:GDSL-type esterase/lipase family protein [Actinomycetota bacterium]
CHRSVHAYIHQTELAERSVSLACSGATSANVSLASTAHYTEGSQAARLIDVATRHRVTAVAVQVGADDDPAYASVVLACVEAYLNPLGPGCAQTIGPQWPSRLAAMAPKVTKALGDVRQAMSRAGYPAASYELVLSSYTSPVTEHMDPVLHGPAGCPFRIADARWGRTVAVAQLSEVLRGVATQAGVRFLDLSRASEGHEACSRLTPAQEWQTRLTVNPQAVVHGGLDAVSIHLVQESLHPNAAGHAQIGNCLGEFLRSAAVSAQCLISPDGRLHAVTSIALAHS